MSSTLESLRALPNLKGVHKVWWKKMVVIALMLMLRPSSEL